MTNHILILLSGGLILFHIRRQNAQDWIRIKTLLDRKAQSVFSYHLSHC